MTTARRSWSGGAGLAAHAVDVEPHAEVCTSSISSGGDQPRAGRVEGLARLALDPLAAALELEGALADVVDEHVAGDRVARPPRRVEVAACAGR